MCIKVKRKMLLTALDVIKLGTDNEWMNSKGVFVGNSNAFDEMWKSYWLL